MASHLFSTKPLHELILTCSQLDPRKQSILEIQLKKKMKCRMRNVGHFVFISMSGKNYRVAALGLLRSVLRNRQPNTASESNRASVFMSTGCSFVNAGVYMARVHMVDHEIYCVTRTAYIIYIYIYIHIM